MSSAKLAAINHLIDTSPYWFVLDNGHFGVGVYQDYAYKVQKTVSAEDLAFVHPLLPDSLRGFIDWQLRKNNCEACSSVAIQLLRNYLTKKTYPLVQPAGSKHVFFSIDEFADENDGAFVWVNGREYHLCLRQVGDQTLTFPVGIDERNIPVCVAFMCEQYPGWQDRLLVANSLGLSDKAHAMHVFDVPESNSAALALPEITFD